MKRVIIIVTMILCITVMAVLFLFSNEETQEPDLAMLNDAIMIAKQEDGQTEAVKQLGSQLTQLYKDMNSEREGRDKVLCFFLLTFLTLFVMAIAFTYWYIDKSILMPFRKLKGFAKNIAAGNLDIPLEMDRQVRFGAFTESFDLMREELKRAREGERMAAKSKKELVASLSHDIKTPVASIKAVTELLMAKSSENLDRLEIILSKADQIDLLITNMFHAALEELVQLKVVPCQHSSTLLVDIIREADYNHRVGAFEIPECMITADKARLQQVFDNIVSNSYKYANTDMRVQSRFEGPYLIIRVSDSGSGVAQQDLALVFEKYYRGKNADGKNGTGLGLYISKYLMNKMDGDLQCVQTTEGFSIDVMLNMN